MKSTVASQISLTALISEALELIDALYPQCDAQIDNVIDAFRKQALLQIEQCQKKLINDTDQTSLNSLLLSLRPFIDQLRAISDEQDVQSFNPQSSFNIGQKIASDNYVAPYASFTSVVNNYISNSNQLFNQGAAPSNPDTVQEDVNDTIRLTLKTYYKTHTTMRLPILEIEQHIEENYVNLALVDEAEQRSKEERVLRAEQPSSNLTLGPFSNRLGTYEDIYHVVQSVPFTRLFEHSQQVIVMGRAGIGKTTFCKYITYQWSMNALWSEFTTVYWLPLRHLRYYKLKPGLDPTVIELAHLSHFIRYVLSLEEQGGVLLSELTEERLVRQLNDRRQKILLLLDGLDEAEMLLQVKNTQEKTLAGRIMELLLKQPHYILTSRPYAVQRSLFPLPKHYYYELLGFTDANIPNYIMRAYRAMQKPEAEAQGLIQLLQKNPSIWGVAHVPVHLAMICALLTPSVFANDKYVTMSMLYHALVLQLGKRFIEQQCNESTSELRNIELKAMISPLFDFLGDVALTGLIEDTLIFDCDFLEPIIKKHNKILSDYLDRLKHQTSELVTGETSLSQQLLALLKPVIKTGFLHAVHPQAVNTQEATINNIICYFPHASLQEYFGAYRLSKWVRKEIKFRLNLKQKNYSKAWNFIKQTIGDQRYEIVYWFLAGFLQVEPKRLEKYFNIIIANFQKNDLVDKVKKLFNAKELKESTLIDRLLKEEKVNNFRYILLLSRCIEEANLPLFHKKAEILQLYKILSEMLFIRKAHMPINRNYRWWVDYLKLSPRLLDDLDIIELLTDAKETAQDNKIRMRLGLTLSQLKIENVVDSLIRIIEYGQEELRCEAIESLVAIMNPSEKPCYKAILLNCMKNTLDSVSFTAAKTLLEIDRNVENLSWLIKHLLYGNDTLKTRATQFLLDKKEDELLALLCQLDLSLKDNLLRKTFIFKWSDKDIINPLTPAQQEARICVVGDQACGKSSLVLRFIDGIYVENYNSTIEDIYHIHAEIDSQTWLFDIIDTSGIQEYESSRNQTINSSEIVIICFSINRRHSFQFAHKLCLDVATNRSKPILLAGLKKDLEDERQISYREGVELAGRYGTNYIECSAKTNENIRALLSQAAQIISLQREKTKKFQADKSARIRIIALLTSIDITDNSRSQLLRILQILQDDRDASIASYAKILLSRLNSFDGIKIFSLMHNMQYSILQEASSDKLDKLEKDDPRGMINFYTNNLINSNLELIKIILSRLSHLRISHEKEVIAVYFKMLTMSEPISKMSEDVLLEPDIILYDGKQRAIICKICMKNLSDLSPVRRRYALNKLEKLDMTSKKAVIKTHINNLRHVDQAIYETAEVALREIKNSLSETQCQEICKIHIKNLDHASSWRRQFAMYSIERMGKTDTPEVLAKYIENLAHNDQEIYISAANVVLRPERKLNKTQYELVWKAYIKNLSHTHPFIRQEALKYLQNLARKSVNELLPIYIDSLPDLGNNVIDLYSYCDTNKDLWITFNKLASNDFKDGLLRCLKGKITLSTVVAAIILLQIDSTRTMLHWLIKPLLSDSLFVQKTMLEFLLEKAQDKLLAELYQIDPLLRTLLRKMFFYQPSLKYSTDIKSNLKIALVGSEGCGKSALLSRFIFDKYAEDYYPTIQGTHHKPIEVDGQLCNLKLFDTAGNMYYINTRNHWVAHSDIVLVCFIINDKASFAYAKEFCKTYNSSKLMLLIGMKKDLVNECQAHYQEGMELAEFYQLKYFECSAKTGENINELFVFAVKAVSISIPRMAVKEVPKRYHEIFMPSRLSDDRKNKLKEVFEKLVRDADVLTQARAKTIVIELETRNALEINVKMHIDNMLLGEKVIERLSLIKLQKLEKKYKNKMIEIYKNMLKNCNREQEKKLILAGLKQLGCRIDNSQKPAESNPEQVSTSNIIPIQEEITPNDTSLVDNAEIPHLSFSSLSDTMQLSALISQQGSPIITSLPNQNKPSTDSANESAKSFT